MNERCLIKGDYINYFSKGNICYGEVINESWSPVLTVRVLYEGTKKVNKEVTIQKSMLTICK